MVYVEIYCSCIADVTCENGRCRPPSTNLKCSEMYKCDGDTTLCDNSNNYEIYEEDESDSSCSDDEESKDCF